MQVWTKPLAPDSGVGEQLFLSSPEEWKRSLFLLYLIGLR